MKIIIQMNRITFILLAAIFIILNSCQKEDDPNSQNTNIIGSWKVSENSTTYGQQYYYVDISSDTTASNKIIIDNFFGLGLGKSVPATQSGQTLTISNAIIPGYTFNGTGSISSNYNSISWNYNVDDGNGPENVTATYTRY